MRAEAALAPDSAAAKSGAATPPLIAHVIYRLNVGGLENGVVNLINRIPADRFRHAIICLTDDSDFRRRIERSDVPIFSLRKPPGNSPLMHLKLWRLLRRLRPEIVHTRNLAAQEAMLTAALAGVPVRVHGEHGRDVEDIDGSNAAHQRLRRFFKPFVHRYVALSQDLQSYLEQKIGVPAARITRICNGVDIERFHPSGPVREPLEWPRSRGDDLFVIGSVGRMQPVKDPLNLVKAFALLVDMVPQARARLRLAMAGDGLLWQQARDLLARAGLLELAWLPGLYDDIPCFMRGMDLFVLPSLAEGISNTLLEAMASGLPVVATRVGGNAELLEEGKSGRLVSPADPRALAMAMRDYVLDRELAKRHGAAARSIAEQRFGLEVMVRNYMHLYEHELAHARREGKLSARRASLH